MKKRIALLLSGALLALSFTACSEKYTTPVTVDGQGVPAGVYLMCQLSAYSEASNNTTDTKTDLLKQQIDGKDASEWINARTQELCRTYVYGERTFDEKGMTISDEDKATQQATIDKNWESYSSFYEKNGIGKESYTSYFMNNYKQQQLYNAYMAEVPTVTDEEAKAYLDADYARMDYIMLPLISFTDYSALDSDKATAVRLAGDSLAKGLNDGTLTTDEAVKKYVKDAYTVAGYADVDVDTNPSSYVYSNLISKESTDYTADLINGLFAAEVGGPWTVVEQGNYLVVYHRTANYADEAAFQSLKSSIETQMHSDAYTKQIEAVYNAYDYQEDSGAIRHYSLKKVSLDTAS